MHLGELMDLKGKSAFSADRVNLNWEYLASPDTRSRCPATARRYNNAASSVSAIGLGKVTQPPLTAQLFKILVIKLAILSSNVIPLKLYSSLS